MSVYSWETSGSGHHQRKKVKKTGTVVLHPDDHVDTAFARLQKEVTVERRHTSQREAEEALANPQLQQQHTVAKSALMTAATANMLEQKMGFEALLPCQAQCYRGIFNGRDVILHSRTGSGKTLAYALPLIERHLLMERGQQQQQAAEAEAAGEAVPHGPFLLIFVFSNDLAMQTKSVLTKIYGKQTDLRIAVAGFDDLQPTHVSASSAAPAPSGKKTKKGNAKSSSGSSGNGGAVDILIGTVRTIDEAIRGHRVAAAENAAEDAEAEREAQRLVGSKRPRSAAAKQSTKTTEAESDSDDEGEEDDDSDDDAVDADSENEGDATAQSTNVKTNTKKNSSSGSGSGAASDAAAAASSPAAVREAGVINPARVRAVVVDEVDMTLGPRFSTLGRRMKNLLKFIRRANGALSEGLLNDFRAHHYVLCGATIPNWVLKAGFLGVKKYYYQLVTVGTAKLPPQLECFQLPCKAADRVAVATRLLTRQATFNGRVVVFGTARQLEALEASLRSEATAAAAAKSPSKPSKKNAAASAASSPVVRALTADKDDLERVAAIEDFNAGVATVLLCTDVAARGLDFTHVDTVLMLNLPRNTLAADTFVHRAGRTARVGRPGRCVLLHDTTEAATVDGIVRSTHVVMKALPAAVAMSAAEPSAKGDAAAKAGAAASSKSKAPSSVTTAAAESVVTLRLVVRNPFRYSKPQLKVPTAMEVFTSNVDVELRQHVSELKEEEGTNGEAVRFRVPASHVHEVKQKLWKYTLQEA